MGNPGFQLLTLRGTEWAATGKVTIAGLSQAKSEASGIK